MPRRSRSAPHAVAPQQWCLVACYGELVNDNISERFASTAPTGCAAPLTVVVCVDPQQLAGDMISPPWETLLDAHVRLTDAEVAAKRSLIEAYAVDTLLSSLPAILLRLTFKFVNRKATFPATVSKIITVVKAIRDQLSGTFTHKPLEICAALLLDALQLEVPAHEMTVGIAQQLHALDVRVHFPRVYLCRPHTQADTNHQEDSVDSGHPLVVLLNATEQIATGAQIVGVDSPLFCVELLVIIFADLAWFRAECTALESARNVETLRLWNVFTTGSRADRTSKWQWLTRAVFASSSRTSVRHLILPYGEYIDLCAVDAVRCKRSPEKLRKGPTVLAR